jgi:hypothetical protein
VLTHDSNSTFDLTKRAGFLRLDRRAQSWYRRWIHPRPDLSKKNPNSEPSRILTPSRVWFVHGLTGNREKTWTHPETLTFWPDLIAEDFPLARVISFGYDANIAKFARTWENAQNAGLRSYGEQLVNAVRNARQGNEALSTLPIYFIAHSLGGLVVEQALLLSIGPDESLQAVAEQTKGIAFMGTPHEGSHLAKWGDLFRQLIPQRVRDTNSKILNVLKPNSEVCVAVENAFNSEAKHGKFKDIKLCSFYETKTMPAFTEFIVPKLSAVLPADPMQPISGTHVSMVQFRDGKDSEYAKVKGQLESWLKGEKTQAATSRTPGAKAIFSGSTVHSMSGGLFRADQNYVEGNQFNQTVASGGHGVQAESYYNNMYGGQSPKREDGEDEFGGPSPPPEVAALETNSTGTS